MRGKPGNDGDIGDQGDPGFKGQSYKGDKGESGNPGVVTLGDKGDKGEKGSRGMHGEDAFVCDPNCKNNIAIKVRDSSHWERILMTQNKNIPHGFCMGNNQIGNCTIRLSEQTLKNVKSTASKYQRDKKITDNPQLCILENGNAVYKLR